MGTVVTINNFTGGMADGSRRGYQGSFQDGIGLDYKTDPDKLTALKKLKKDSASSVTDLIKWFIEYNTDVWMYGDTGKIYKRTSSAVYTNPKTVSSSHGNGMAIFNDNLWYLGDSTLGRTTSFSGGSPTFNDNYFRSLDTEQVNFSSLTGQTYTLQTSITETSTHRKTFTAAATTMTGVALNIDTLTGNWTITVHDASNNNLGTVTVANASLGGGTNRNRFNFTNPIQLTVGQSYHFHVTTSTGTSKMVCGTLNDHETIQYALFASYNDKDVDVQNNLTSTNLVTGTSYLAQIGLIESALHVKTFVPTVSTIAALSFEIGFAPSTVTSISVAVHDEFNTVIGTTTLAWGSTYGEGNGGRFRFNFSSPLSVNPGQTYHFHIYTVGATAQIMSSDSLIGGINYEVHFQVINSDTDYHMAEVFTNKLCIGNGRSLATVDDSEIYEPESVLFPKGERVRCLETIGDYIAISTWKGTTLGDYGKSRVYFWDGVSDTFNAFIDIDGQVNAMLNGGNNTLYIWHGTSGQMSVYTGGITKLRQLKGVGENKTCEIYPGAISSWEGLVYFGISAGSTTALDRLIYSYGQKDKDYPMSLNKDYPISTGNKGSTVQIGAVVGINATTFLVGWKDSSTYGVDIIDTANDQASVTMTTLRLDAGIPNRNKGAKSLNLTFDPITSTQTITVEYRFDNTGAFTTLGTVDGTSASDVGKKYKSFTSKAFKAYWFELEVKLTLATSSADAPNLKAMEIELETYSQSQQGRK